LLKEIFIYLFLRLARCKSEIYDSQIDIAQSRVVCIVSSQARDGIFGAHQKRTPEIISREAANMLYIRNSNQQ
jgi:hypothetical protein